MKLLHEDIRDSLEQAGQKACGYMNCKLFVQTVTGVPKLDELPSRPFRSIGDLTTGDVLKWGTGTHWAIYLGNGDIMEVEEWGAESRIIPFEEVVDEMDPPDMVFSTAVPQRETLLREYIRQDLEKAKKMKLLREYIVELDSNPQHLYLSETMLHEGLDPGMVKDGIQFIVAGAAEYGLGAVTLPAAGAGLAVGPTVETIVDSLFATEEVAGTVSAVANIGSKLGQYGELWDEARSAYGDDLAVYYQTLVKIVRQALDDLGEKAEEKVEEIADKLAAAIKKLISRLVGALKAGIKIIIPDATIGLAATKAFEEVLEALSENAFDLLSGAISKVKMLKDFVSDPSIAVNFFKDVFTQVIELMFDAAKKLEDMSWVKAMLAAGPAGGAALKKLGPAGLEKAAKVIKDKMPSILEIIDSVLTVLVPTVITAVGLHQVLLRGDWKKEGSNGGGEVEKEKLAASYNTRDNALLRRYIKELM